MDEGTRALLPPELRQGGDVDQYVETRMSEFATALEAGDRAKDPVRNWIALETIRLAMDPRVDKAEIRARSGALLNASKVLGLDRDIQRFEINATSVEAALTRLRESAMRGADAAGPLSGGDGSAHEEVPEGPPILLREPSARRQRAVEDGPVREAVPDAGNGSGHD